MLVRVKAEMFNQSRPAGRPADGPQAAADPAARRAAAGGPPLPSAGPAKAAPRRALSAAGLALLVLLVFAASLVTYSKGALNLSVFRIDLDVYRSGASAWLHGRNLYGWLPPVQPGLELGFTYPPMSAVVMAPLAMLSARAAGVVITAVTLLLLLAVTALFLRSAELFDRRRSWAWAAGLLPLAALIEPVRTTLAYGQINVVLMALVAFDCLAPNAGRVGFARVRLFGRVSLVWPRGTLVGIAAALKLTPAFYVVFFLARRDWRAALTSAASFAAMAALGFIVAPHDSVSYWGTDVFNTGRIGPLDFAGNQSLNGVLLRTRLTGSVEHDVWLAAAAATGLLALFAIYRAARTGRTLLALTLTACLEELCSPVSWSHHWVWAAPVLLTAAVAAWRARRFGLFAWACVGIALFVSGPEFWFPHTQDRELNWGLWENVVGSAYVWVALGALVWYALPEIRHQARRLRDRAAAAESPTSSATGS